MGLVLEPNKPIYRNQNGEEFNIVFNEETIKDLSYGFFKNNNHSNSTIEHDIDQNIKGVTFTESWIVENPTNDKSNNFGFSYPKGSWVAVMKVDDDAIWNDYVKTGKVQGFSIDAMLSLEEVNLKSNIEMSNTNSLLERILLAITPKQAEIKLGSIMLLDGSVKIEFEGETLSTGAAIWVVAEEGVKVPVPVGEHPLEDGTILIVTEEGIAGEIKPAEAPAEPNAPVDANEPTDGKVSNDAKIASEIESAIKSILIKYTAQDEKITSLENQIAELAAQPASKPIQGTPVQVMQKGKFSTLLNKLNNN
jgi:hypothetical protein